LSNGDSKYFASTRIIQDSHAHNKYISDPSLCAACPKSAVVAFYVRNFEFRNSKLWQEESGVALDLETAGTALTMLV
jgi:hypothetical protein